MASFEYRLCRIADGYLQDMPQSFPLLIVRFGSQKAPSSAQEGQRRAPRQAPLLSRKKGALLTAELFL